MKIPKKIKIGGHIVTVKVVDKVAEDPEVQQWAGGWTESQNLIEIRAGQAQSQKEVTLIHEILHCINLQLNHDHVEFLSQALYQVIKDNKLYFDGKEDVK